MGKRKRKSAVDSGARATRPTTQPMKRSPLSHDHLPAWRWLPWLLVSLTIYAALPGMTSGNYLPKTFWAAGAVALGLLFLPPRYTGRLEITLVGAAWMVYMAWALLSIAWAPGTRAGLERWLALLLPTLAYLLAKRTRFWNSTAFWTAFCILVGVNALIGFLQYASERYVPSFVKSLVDWFPGTAIPRATMGERNYAGMYFSITIPFLAWFYYRSPGRRSILPLLSLGMGVLFLFLTRMRAAWLGTLMGLLFLVLAGLPKRLKPHPGKNRILAGCVAAAILAAIFLKPAEKTLDSMGSKTDFLHTLKNFTDPTGRTAMWTEVLSVPINRLTGAGFGSFPIVATPWSSGQSVKTLNWEVHNDYLQAFVDLGIPGLLLFTLTFVLLLRLAWRQRGSAGLLLAAGASMTALSVMQFFTFTSEVLCSITWATGVAAILNSQSQARPLVSPRISPAVPLILNLMAAAWLFCFTIAVGFSIAGDRAFARTISQIGALMKLGPKASDSQKMLVRNGIKRLAFETLPKIQFDANMRHYHSHTFASYAMEAKDYESASRFAKTALGLHPNDRSCILTLAQIALDSARAASEKKQPEEAARSLDETERYLRDGVKRFGFDPYASFASTLAKVLTLKGKPSEAKAVQEETAKNRVGVPENPQPPNRALDVASPVSLAWSDCNAARTYALYLWKVGEIKPEKPLMIGLKQSKVPEGLSLEPNTVYLWQVEAKGQYGRPLGELWFFRTARNSR